MSTVIKDLGAVSAYAYAVEKGYTGTEADFAELMADYAEVGQRAEDAAQTATTKAGEAQTSAQTASSKASEASQSATTASTKASEATTAASNATTAKDDAVTAKTAAETAQGLAEQAKADAITAKTDAESARDEAQEIVDGISAKAEQIDNNTAEITELKNDGVAPSAEQLLSKNTTADAVPYLFRQTGGDGADRLYDQIVGGTVNWNQQIQDGNFADGSGWTANKGNVSVASNKLTFTLTEKNNYAYVGRADLEKSIVGHKYFVGAYITVSEASSYLAISRDGVYSDRFFALAVNARTYCAKVLDATASNGNFYIYPRREGTGFEVGSTMIVEDAICHDLTAMFGSTVADYIYQLEQTTAGAGVALFKSLFPNDYYEYNAGELLSVSGLSEHKMVGFNQWDEEWEVGGISTKTGANESANDIIRSKNYIDVLPNTAYYCTYANGTAVYNCFFYDSDKNFISHAVTYNGLVTTPSNCAFMRFRCKASYGTTYNHDICINLSDPAKNGTYEPYKAHSYPLDSTLTLRGLFKLDANNKLYADGDTYDADGTVTRKYGIVDLGTLTWTYSSERQWFNTAQKPFPAKFPAYTTDVANIVCAKYPTVSNIYMRDTDPTVIACSMNNSGFFIVKDTAYTDATAFKTAMSGVMLVYELATPTTEEAEPYQHLQQCDPSGTEEYVSTGIVPIGHNSFYPENLRAKVEGLPWNFASLIAPTESTFTATRNYVTGALFIADNVLYKATSNIANGGTITPNTNCTATTLAEIISALA